MILSDGVLFRRGMNHAFEGQSELTCDFLPAEASFVNTAPIPKSKAVLMERTVCSEGPTSLRAAPAQVKLNVQPELAGLPQSNCSHGLTESHGNRRSVTCRKAGCSCRTQTTSPPDCICPTGQQNKSMQRLACYVKKMETHVLRKNCTLCNKYFSYSCV